MPRWVRQAIFLWWAVFVALWSTLMVTRQLRGLLIQLVVALFLSFAMEPLVDRLSNRGWSRSLATAATMFGVGDVLRRFSDGNGVARCDAGSTARR